MIQHTISEHHFFPNVEWFVQRQVHFFFAICLNQRWIKHFLRNFYMWLTFYNLCQTIETPRTLLDYSVIYSKPWFWNSRNQPYNYFIRINNMLNKAKITFKRSFFNSNPLHWLNRIFFNSAACLHNICHFTNRNHLKTTLINTTHTSSKLFNVW